LHVTWQKVPSIDEDPFHAGRCFQVQRKNLGMLYPLRQAAIKIEQDFYACRRRAYLHTCPEFF
jgi:hypothetical protein